jgi:EAL domain-containing protein (putative c-di-GMP-specific phosphodiesterase class I)
VLPAPDQSCRWPHRRCRGALRWKAESGELIPPERFIAIAEYSGLIVDIGQWCCATPATVRSPSPRPASPVSDGGECLPRPVPPPALHPDEGAIADTGINPALLELEITESMAMLEPDGSITGVIREVKALGISVWPSMISAPASRPCPTSSSSTWTG